MSCDTPITVKAGDTFSASAIYKDSSDNAIDLTDYTIESQVRDMQGNLLSSLTIVKLNQTTDKGKYTLSCDTSSWPIASVQWDVKYTINGTVVHTDTQKISVVQSITI